MGVWKHGLGVLDQNGNRPRNNANKRVVIVGAGIAGLTAGKVLKDAG